MGPSSAHLIFFLSRVLTELVSKMRDMQMDKTELGCLRAIILFNPGTRIRTITKHSTATLGDKYLSQMPENHINAEISSMFPHLFSDILNKITFLFFLKMLRVCPTRVRWSFWEKGCMRLLRLTANTNTLINRAGKLFVCHSERLIYKKSRSSLFSYSWNTLLKNKTFQLNRTSLLTTLTSFLLTPLFLFRFAKLLLRLPALRSIGLKCLEHLFFFKLIGDTPIDTFLMEMLEAPHQLT